MLDEHAPVLRYDSQERERLTSVEHFLGGSERGSTVYGRRVGDRFVQYWLLYAYNAQDRGIVRTGRHEGDWEMVQLELDAGNRLRAVTFTQHSSAETCPASELELVGRRPVVYVANGSHALYPRPGVHDRPFPDPNDEARGDGRLERPEVARFVAWVRREERWGASEASFVPGEQSSPRGPSFQGERWDSPADFSRNARACGTLPGRPVWLSLAAAAAALVLAAASAALLLARRRRKPAG